MSDEKKPLLEHLGELRKRLILCLLAAVVGMIAAYVVYDMVILNIVRGPIDALGGRMENPFARWTPLLPLLESFRAQLQNPEFSLHYIGPLEGFATKLKLSLVCGIVIALPFILFQIWRFVAVGLTKQERKLTIVYFPLSLVLFGVGILFAYLVMLPVGLYFLIRVSNELIPVFTVSKYATVVYMLVFIFGVIFELPLVILFLTRLGLVTPKLLAQKRKYAVLLVFVLAAVLTPPDIFTQVMLALPVILLYELSILISKLAYRKRLARQADAT